MIQLSPRGQAVYQLLSLVVALLLLYGVGILAAATDLLPTFVRWAICSIRLESRTSPNGYSCSRFSAGLSAAAS